MRSKTRRAAHSLAACVAALALATLAWPAVATAQTEADDAPATANHNLEAGKNMDILNALYRQLDMVYVDTVNPTQLYTAGIRGMLHQLDPYTEYYPESETKNLQMMLTGKYAGIGALIRYHLAKKRVVVDEPYRGMPAQEVGLRKGDVILQIDDSLCQDKNTAWVSSHLRGDAGTTFRLRVYRPSEARELTFDITRRNIKLPELPYYGLLPSDGNGQGVAVGYISLTGFTEGNAQAVRRAFIELKEQGAKALVLDLRANGGGSEQEAVDLLSVFVPKDICVVENRGKVEQACKRYETRLEPVDTLMPMAVLVGPETASAAEITAGALQDLDRAVVVGQRTFGKGLVQVPLELPYNTNVKITTARYYIPSGRCIQAVNYSRGDAQVGYRERVPDSLTHVFHTRAGREVRDGGGIKPDLEARNDTMPNIAYYLGGTGIDSTEVAFDWVVDYIAAHKTIAAPMDFHLTDAEYQDFCDRVMKSGFKYDAESRRNLDRLVSAAKFEGYYEDNKALFDQLSERLKHDVAQELKRHETVIRRVLEGDIITAYHYHEGAMQVGLQYDKVLQQAQQLLADPARYQQMLQPVEAPAKPEKASKSKKAAKAKQQKGKR